MPNPYDCALFSHMAAPRPSSVTTISCQTHRILVTVDAFHAGLCHEGIKNQLSPCQARFLWLLTQERNMMMMTMMMMMMRMTMGMTMRMTTTMMIHQYGGGKGVPTIGGGRGAGAA